MRLCSRQRMKRCPQVRGPAREMSLVPAMGRLPGVMMLRLHGLVLIAGRVLAVAPRWGAALQTSPCRHRLEVARQVGVLASVITVLTTWLMAPLPRRPMP